MNKLKMMRTYLIGAMDRIKDRGYAWRESVGVRLEEKYNVIVLNPLKKPINIGDEGPDFAIHCDTLLEQEKYDELSKTMKVVRSVDLRMVDTADFITCYLDLHDNRFGTVEEFSLANREKKPILTVIEQGKKHAPKWMFGMIPHQHIFSNWDEYFNYLDNVNSGKDERTFNRWQFFDLEKETLKALGVAQP